LLEIHEHGNEVDTSKLASEVDWRSQMKSTSWVRAQGSCGSCWAVAAVGALETQMEKVSGNAVKLSHQQLVDCVINKQHCGGKGGCDGATAEKAFELTTRTGISSDADYKSLEGGKCNTNAPSSLSVTNFVRLPVNKASHLLNAVANHGPVVVSADGGEWFSYGANADGHFGVFSDCARDTVVNHAVLATGYGESKVDNKLYWLVRNSWGEHWGDNGFIKVERHLGDNDWCGTNKAPEDGVFCDDHPKTAPVCGMCGIASDSVYAETKPTSRPPAQTFTAETKPTSRSNLRTSNQFAALEGIDSVL